MICENCCKTSSNSSILMVTSDVEKKLMEISKLKAIAVRKKKELEMKTNLEPLLMPKSNLSNNTQKVVSSMHSKIQSIKSRLDELNLSLLENTLNLSACYHRLEKLRLKRDNLEENCNNQRTILQSFQIHLNKSSKVVKTLRLTRVVELMISMRIIIPTFNLPSKDLPGFISKSVQSHGIGYICGLPVPSLAYGPQLNLFLPTEIFSTILGSICHLLDSLSTLLNIPLLHPVYPFETEESIVTSAGQQLIPLPLYRISNREIRYQTKWKSAIKSYIDYQKHKSTITSIDDKKNVPSPVSAAESTSNSKVLFKSDTDRKIEYGLNLLQSNVVDICQKLGLHSDQIFEPTAIIYNIYMIQIQCEYLISTTQNHSPSNGRGRYDTIQSDNYLFSNSLRAASHLISKHEKDFQLSFSSSDLIIQKALSQKYHTNRTQLMMKY